MTKLFRTGNPALNSKTFENFTSHLGHMTIDGTVNKSFLLLILLFISSFISWINAEIFLQPIMFFGSILTAFILSMVIIFKKELAPILAPIYVILEGFALGAISLYFESMFPNIVIQAVLITFGILFSLLLAYKSGLIEVTENFKLGVIAATGGIAIFYVISIIVSFFGFNMPLIQSNSIWGILFTLFVVIIASLNLVLDFDFIEEGAAKRAPKYMEWYAAFGLMITLIWLYLEILRLLAKTGSRK